MSESKSYYNSIMKATAIFGGVQVFNILITLIRGKTIAVLLGTAGMGLNGLLMSALKLVGTLTSLGIDESAVRDISKAHSSNDELQMRTTFQVFKRLIWLTAVLGIIVTICFSPLLSKYAFGDTSKTTSFILLSVTFIFGALSGGIYTFLRGTRQIKLLAQANIFGGIIGLIVSIPIFYFYGIDGVIASIIATSLANYFVSLYFKSKISYAPVLLSFKETVKVAKPIVQLGLSLTLIGVLSSGVAFILVAFISKTGTLSDVGLYNAGNAIVDGYVGMVFMAMSTDYFPRLSGVIKDNVQWKKLVNEQAELVLIILAIIMVLLITTTPLLIHILLSKEFMASENFIQFAALAIPLKGLAWVMGFVILAKGNNKLFLTIEVAGSIIVLGFNLLFYHFYGLKGLGISYTLSYLLFASGLLYVLNKIYNFQFTKGVLKLLFISLSSLILCLISIYCLTSITLYLVQFCIVLVSVSYNVYEFNKRISILKLIKKLKIRKNN